MALSFKFAVIASLFFIGGMCGLVHQAERPIAGLPSLSGGPGGPVQPTATILAPAAPESDRNAVREDAAARDPAGLRRPAWADQVVVSGRFAHGTALEREASVRPEPGALLPARELVFAPAAESHLPPVAEQSDETPGAINTLIEAALLGVASGDLQAVADEMLVPAGADQPEAVPAPEVASPERDGPAVANVTPISAAESLRGTVYTVQSGDSLSRIAQRAWGSDAGPAVATLLRANDFLRNDPSRLQAGHKLVIPEQVATAPVRAASARAGASRAPVAAAAKPSSGRSTANRAARAAAGPTAKAAGAGPQGKGASAQRSARAAGRETAGKSASSTGKQFTRSRGAEPNGKSVPASRGKASGRKPG
jgi:LysM repeat protein